MVHVKYGLYITWMYIHGEIATPCYPRQQFKKLEYCSVHLNLERPSRHKRLREIKKPNSGIPIHSHSLIGTRQWPNDLSHKHVQGLSNYFSVEKTFADPPHGRGNSFLYWCIEQGEAHRQGWAKALSGRERTRFQQAWLAVACFNHQTKQISCRGERKIKHVCFCVLEAIRDL